MQKSPIFDKNSSESLLDKTSEEKPPTSPTPPAKDNPVRGTIYFLCFGVCSAIGLFTMKATFVRNPDCSAW